MFNRLGLQTSNLCSRHGTCRDSHGRMREWRWSLRDDKLLAEVANPLALVCIMKEDSRDLDDVRTQWMIPADEFAAGELS